MSETSKEGKKKVVIIGGHGTRDAEELKEVLKTVREEVPGLVKDLLGPLKELMSMTLDEKQATERAKALASFYKTLVDSGMSEEVAMRMTEQQFVNPASILDKVLGSAKERRTHVEKEEE